MPESSSSRADALVSVITPLYNHAQYLSDYIQGLVSQTYPHIELIVIDDGSTDDSWSLLDTFRSELEGRFERLDISRNPANLGLLKTLEQALTKVTGSFTCILESDDFFYPGKIAANVERLATSDHIGLVHSDVDFLHESNGRLERAHWKRTGRRIPQGAIYEDLLHENHILTCSACMRTDALLETIDLERYAAAGYKTADYPLFLDLAKQFDVAYIDEPLACYRVVEESISHPTNLARQLEWKLAYYRVKIDQIEIVEVSEEVEQRARSQYHRTRFQLGWLRGDASEVESASQELERLEPTVEIRSWGGRVRRRLVRSRLTWRIGRMLEKGLRAGQRLRS